MSKFRITVKSGGGGVQGAHSTGANGGDLIIDLDHSVRNPLFKD